MCQPSVRTEVALHSKSSQLFLLCNQSLNFKGIFSYLPPSHQHISQFLCLQVRVRQSEQTSLPCPNCTQLSSLWNPSERSNHLLWHFPHPLAHTWASLPQDYPGSLKAFGTKPCQKPPQKFRDYNQTLNYSIGLMRHDLHLKHPVYCCLVMFLLISFCITVSVNSPST